MSQAHSKCLPLDPWIQDTLPPLLHPTLSHKPCLPASLTPSSPVDQGSRQAGDSLFLSWAGLLSTPLSCSHPRTGGGRAAWGSCESLHGGRLGASCRAGRGSCWGTRGRTLASLALVLTHPLRHTSLHPPPGASAQIALLRFLREPEWPSGRRNGHTQYHEALAYHH